ncbi:glutamine amidotransferase [Acrasis kona]|uniref:Glutamine amidotransferase n=1 Tax=Acrasis kona TaxID=1008807 RepID=A0AAW2ZG14_9EUKA
MCRLFAYIGKEPCLLEDVLVLPKHAISKQVNEHYLPEILHNHTHTTQEKREAEVRNKLLNVDGYGLSWYTRARSDFGECDGPRPCTYHSVRPPINDTNFKRICANTASCTLFAHIRAATGVTKVVETNNHPFEFGRHLFMHNGSVAHFGDIKREILNKISNESYNNIYGTTDTEHVAALYFTYLGDFQAEHSLEEMKVAMLKTLNDLNTMINKFVQNTRGSISEDERAEECASSLNLVTTDGKKLLCTRFRSHATQQPPSLYYSTKAGIRLNRKYPGDPDSPSVVNEKALKSADEHSRHVIVASEPSTYEVSEWKLIKKNYMLCVDDNIVVSEELIELDH